MNLKTAWQLYTSDKSLKDLNTWTNDVTALLTHLVLFGIGVIIAEDHTFFKYILGLYLIFVVLAMVTPSK